MCVLHSPPSCFRSSAATTKNLWVMIKWFLNCVHHLISWTNCSVKETECFCLQVKSWGSYWVESDRNCCSESSIQSSAPKESKHSIQLYESSKRSALVFPSILFFWVDTSQFLWYLSLIYSETCWYFYSVL